MAELIKRGISDKMASELLAGLRPDQSVMDQIEYFDHVITSDVRGKLTSPTGFLVSLVRDNARVPEDFPTSAKLKQLKREKVAETELRMRYYAYQKERALRYIETLPARDQEELRQENARLWEGMPEAQKQEMTDLSMFSSVAESGQVEIFSFERWKASNVF